MAKKEFAFRGKSIDELKAMSLSDLTSLLTSDARRKIKRGFTDEEKVLLKALDSSSKPVKTHCRDMLILPNMVGKNIMIHTGKIFQSVIIQEEMIGHKLGEFALSRKRTSHNSPGVGATRSSASVSVR